MLNCFSSSSTGDTFSYSMINVSKYTFILTPQKSVQCNVEYRVTVAVILVLSVFLFERNDD